MLSDKRHIAVALAGVSAFLNLYAPQAVLPLLSNEFSVGAAEASLIMMASTLSVALTAPFTGAVADVLGRKRVIGAAIVALLVPTVMVSFSSSLEEMIFWRFVQGLLLPPIFAVTVAYIGGEWPAIEATGVTGIYVAASAIGGFLGRFLTGLVADAIGWRGAFLTDAALTAFCAIGVIVLLPRERQFVRQENLAASLRQMLRHLRNPTLVATYAVGFGTLFNFIAVFTYVNFLLAGAPFNLSPAYLGSIFIVYLVGITITPIIGRAVSGLGRRDFVTIAIAFWMLGIALTLISNLAVIIVGLTIAAASGFICQAVATSYVAISAPEGRSSAIGFYVTAFYFGGSAGALIPGLAWSRFGWPSTVAFAAVMLAFMMTVVRMAWERNVR